MSREHYVGSQLNFSFTVWGFLSFPRHTNPIVENGQTHPCQKVIQEVSTDGYSFPFKALGNLKRYCVPCS